MRKISAAAIDVFAPGTRTVNNPIQPTTSAPTATCTISSGPPLATTTSEYTSAAKPHPTPANQKARARPL